MLFFLALSILGCLLCVALHVLTYAGVAGDGSRALATGAFIGAFVVFVAAAAVTMAGPRGAGDKFSFDELWKAAPRWVRRMAVVVFVYCAANFVFFAIAAGEPTVEPTGALTLRSKSKLVRTITPAEFRWHQGLHARMMSGHPLAFYTIAVTMFTGARRQRRVAQVTSREPEPAVPAPAAAAPPTLEYGRSSPRLPIWIHMMLFVLSFMIAWLGMPLLLVTGLGRLVPPPVTALLFLGGLIGGASLVTLLFKRVIPACCPNCLGHAYCTQMSKPTRYLCRDCGYEHVSG